MKQTKQLFEISNNKFFINNDAMEQALENGDTRGNIRRKAKRFIEKRVAQINHRRYNSPTREALRTKRNEIFHSRRMVEHLDREFFVFNFREVA
mgnify:CR=1 FL=1